jgi:serine/threonine protein kinase/Flp pilus assembly protein TadD
MKDRYSIFGKRPDRLDRLVSRALDPSRASEETVPPPSLEVLLEQSGRRIGHYELLHVLGEGGMGVVYRAQQDEPVQRQVALKIIKPGMDSKRVVARFEAEKQTLALLDHPNIAHVYDAGMTESGRPYFVMEVVDGLPITQFCDHHKLGLEDRLALFQQVCSAVQHAHQKGIIHRDIKPSNVMVTHHDGKPVPKVIDFGVAKAIGRPLAEGTMATEDGQLLGTPEYMSPEQTDMANEDIDTRSDIYSLGVLLYVLLAGVLPFDPQKLRASGIEHVRKTIREEDPKTPSARLTKLGEEAKKVAENRCTDVQSLAKHLRRELEWIPLKAMRKERSERYRSASELADDIENYLAGAPLMAGPPSALYRLKKSLARNRASVAGILAVLVVSLIGTVVSLIFALGQARARDEAQTLSDFLRHSVLEALDPFKVGGRQITIRSVLDAASKDLQGKFQGTPMAEAEIRHTIGFAYWSLGLYDQSRSHHRRALEIRRAQRGDEDPTTLLWTKELGWAHFHASRYEEAERLFAKAAEGMRRILGEDDERALDSMGALTMAYCMQGRFQEAERLGDKIMEAARRMGIEEYFLGGLGWGYHLLGRYREAELASARALAFYRRQYGNTHYFTLQLMRNLGELYSDMGRYAEADQLLREAQSGWSDAWGEEHPETLWTATALGWLCYRRGQYKEARSLFDSARQVARRVLGEEHFVTAQALLGLGALHLSQKRYEEAETFLNEARSILCRILGEENWATLKATNLRARLRTAQGRYNEAAGLLGEALVARRRVLGDEHPDTLESLNDLAVLRREQKDYEEAESLLRQALDGRQSKLGNDHPACFESMHELAVLDMRQARWDDAEPLLSDAFHGRETKLGPKHPHTIESLRQLVTLYESWLKPDEAAEWRAELAGHGDTDE